MDQLPRLEKRGLICLLLFTCGYVVSVWRGFLFHWVLGMGCVILLWHSLSLPLIILPVKLSAISLIYILEITRIDVYETLCPQQMLVHKGGKIKNWSGECRDVTPTKLQSQNIFKEHWWGSGWGVRMDVNEKLKFL